MKTPNVAAEADASTRQRVASSILEHGPSTAAELAARLGLTPAASAAISTCCSPRSCRGPRAAGLRRPRPGPSGQGLRAHRRRSGRLLHRVRRRWPIQALEFLADVAGPEAVTRFAERADRRRRGALPGGGWPRPGPRHPRPQALAAALTEDGYVASTLPSAPGEQLCQHHCPVAHVAERFPQLCEVETAGVLPAARRARPATRHHRPRRRRLHHPYPACALTTTSRAATKLTQQKDIDMTQIIPTRPHPPSVGTGADPGRSTWPRSAATSSAGPTPTRPGRSPSAV